MMNRQEAIRHLTRFERDKVATAPDAHWRSFWTQRLDTQLAWIEPLSDSELRRRVGLAQIPASRGAVECGCDDTGANCACRRLDSGESDRERDVAKRDPVAAAKAERDARLGVRPVRFHSIPVEGGSREEMVKRHRAAFEAARHDSTPPSDGGTRADMIKRNRARHADWMRR